LIGESSSTVAFTGAGISVESGLPHFRGEGGLWTKFDPYKVASIQQFRIDPTAYWTYSLNHRPKDPKPNLAHSALVDFERAGLLRAVVTQNTDGLHQQAGSGEVVELHGSSRSVVCLDCQETFPREQIDDLNRRHCPPSCPNCAGRFLKPTVVLFGEALPAPALDRARELAAQADLLLIVGTSLQVYPAASIPRLALECGARLCIVNREPTPFDDRASAVLYGQAGEILPALADSLVRSKA
jgi:NAD-dependent deacetylase